MDPDGHKELAFHGQDGHTMKNTGICSKRLGARKVLRTVQEGLNFNLNEYTLSRCCKIDGYHTHTSGRNDFSEDSIGEIISLFCPDIDSATGPVF